MNAGMMNHDLVSVRIFLSTGIKDYQSLQKYGVFEWKIHRLLWIGYQKNIDNKKCHFSELPKDVINFIITFFVIIDTASNTTYLTKDATLKYIANKYSHLSYLNETTKAFFENNSWCKNVYNSTFPHDHVNNKESRKYPMVRLWCQFGCIEKCYPLSAKHMPPEVVNFYLLIKDKEKNRKRWVEIPDDYLGVRLDDKMIDLANYNRIVVEFICVADIGCMSPDQPTSTVNKTPLYWPLCKQNVNEDNIQVGDIIDAPVKYYEIYIITI